MSAMTPMRRDQRSGGGGGDKYRKCLRSYQTPFTVRRSPRFLPQVAENAASSSITSKNRYTPSKKPSSPNTHLQSLPISGTATPIPSPKKTQQGRSTKCPREPLRSIQNLQGFDNPNQGKPLRRSPRFSSYPSTENAKETVRPVKERRRSSRLVVPAVEKENVGIENLGGREEEEKVDGPKDNVANGKEERKVTEKYKEEKEKKERRRSPRLVGSVKVSEETKNVGIKNLGLREDEKNKVDGSRDNIENEKEQREIKVKKKEEKKMKKRKREEKFQEKTGSKKVAAEKCSGSSDWTGEQDAALQRAYFVAKPSPHFWKKVAKMVPGRSAQECFDRVNGSFDTPPQPQPRSRAKISMLSPISNFSLSGGKSTQNSMPVVKKLCGRKKNLAAQKTVRQLLKKHCVVDQDREADYFSVLETSPSAVSMDLSEVSSPMTPHGLASPRGFLQKCSGGLSSAHQKMLSRFKPLGKASDPSPEVLKKVKNIALHEKYIDQLHNRDARRKFASARAGKNEGVLKAGGVKAAKNALMSEAREFISHFQQLQKNSQGNIDSDYEDDEKDEEDDDYEE